MLGVCADKHTKASARQYADTWALARTMLILFSGLRLFPDISELKLHPTWAWAFGFVLAVTERVTMNLQPWASVSISHCHPSTLLARIARGRFSPSPNRRMRKYPDQGHQSHETSAGMLPRSVRASHKDTEGLGIYSVLPEGDMETRVNIDCQPSVSWTGNCWALQTSFHLTWTADGEVRGFGVYIWC